MELESETHFEEEIPAFDNFEFQYEKRWWIFNQWCKTVAKGCFLIYCPTGIFPKILIGFSEKKTST